MSRAVMALDQGTTSSRAIVFDRQGRILAVAQQEFRQHYPRPGWVEHDLEEIWRTQRETAGQALRRAGLKASDLAAVGIANQRETVALWDRKTGEPVAPAIVWQCRRTAERCREIREQGDEPMLREKTGLVADAYFSATKLAWLLEELPGARKRAERGELAFGTIDSWIAWKLSGGRLHVTDPSNASRTLLFNLRERKWDPALLDYFGIPGRLLPEVRASSEVYGKSGADVLGGPVPIAGIAGDQQAALFGQGCTAPGMMKNTYGTGCFLLANTGETPVTPPPGLLASARCQIGERPSYVLEGAVFIAGAAVQWLRDGLGLIVSAEETEALAGSVRDTGGVHFIPAFVGLGAPHWNAEARGALTGLTRGTTKAHVARAALEAIAFQTVDLLEAMSAGTGEAKIAAPAALRVDGGATANNLLCQIQADLLGVPVERPRVLETTASGAAFLAGLATGFWGGLDELAAIREVDRTFEPAQDAGWREEQLAGWHKAVQRVLL